MSVKFGIGVVDVIVVSPRGHGWRVLALQRAHDTRCPGAWEIVHGRVRRNERPHDAALREMREETGLQPDRLYNVTAHAFYLHGAATVEIAVVFCAFVRDTPRVLLGKEHARAEWISRTAAMKQLAWPGERENLARAWALLKTGTAGPLEDVLRVR